MDKTAIKNFSIWARNKLIEDISYKASLLGITEKKIKSPLPQSTQDVQFFDIGSSEPYAISEPAISQRKKLVEEINKKAIDSDYKRAYTTIIEEVAYTWFNRLIAIRFMEVNDYLPSRVRVLSSEQKGKNEPDLVSHALEVDLNYSIQEKELIAKLKQENKADDLFKMLFIKQCNALNKNLPELFETTNHYTELLFNISYTDREGIVYRLVHDIAEDDFNVLKEGQVEIIGWLYQYYNEERKNEVINIYRGTVKKEDIPAATQLFTTQWVVKYMVDNSLGRYWIERNPNSNLTKNLKYFVSSKKESLTFIDEEISPEKLTVFDPCMGSGHVLVYTFDVLMEIYKECGYSERDAAQLIVKKNIYGLDIDKRAYQLAYFAIKMKARSYDRHFLSRNIEPNIAPIVETNEIKSFEIEGVTTNEALNKIGNYLTQTFKDAEELGSLIKVKNLNYLEFLKYLESCKQEGQLSTDYVYWDEKTKPTMKNLAKQALILSGKYSAVVTNPPYLNKLEGNLKAFVEEHYKEYKGDLFSVFMYRNFAFCKPNAYSAFMTPFVWMFIKTYENLRKYIIENKSITSLIQMEYSAFEEATVPVCTFVLQNIKANTKGLYIRLSDFTGGMEVQRKKVLEALEDERCKYFYETFKENFQKIPGSPVAYWASEAILNAFESGTPLVKIANPRQGLATADNNRFLRLWYEVKNSKTNYNSTSIEQSKESKSKWFPYNKGGQRRQWYGNYDYLVSWENDGFEIRNFKDSKGNLRSRPQNTDCYFKESITWSLITSGGFSIRYRTFGSIHDVAGMSAFSKDRNTLMYILGLMSTKISNHIFKMLNPTINLQIGDFLNFPVISFNKTEILKLVQTNINLSRSDWDMHETSWDFVRHPLIGAETSIATAYDNYKNEVNERFSSLKKNEEELNRIFIKIYGLQDELSPEVSDKDITVAKVFDTKDEIYEEIKGNRYILTKEDVVKSFISYAIGCIFGRYSLDVEGLAYAGGDWDTSKYNRFVPIKNNILLITEEEYFNDDAVGLFANFLEVAYGKNNLEDNVSFIAEALGNKGKTPRETIRNYIIKDFFKDHCRAYKKRPIYWLFDSGRQNAFKALVYLHRYNEDTIGKLRIDYLHKIQRSYESEITRMQDTIDNSANARETAVATKRKEKLIKQLQETKEYDEKIAHLALSRISLDLDDGVKVNYEKIQTDKDGKTHLVLAKI